LKIAQDAELDGGFVCYCGPTPDFKGNGVKMASKARVLFPDSKRRRHIISP
jgi:hypothetical protein